MVNGGLLYHMAQLIISRSNTNSGDCFH